MKWIKRNYRTYGTENEDYQCLLVFNYACFNPWDGAKGVNIFEQFWHIDEDPWICYTHHVYIYNIIIYIYTVVLFIIIYIHWIIDILGYTIWWLYIYIIHLYFFILHNYLYNRYSPMTSTCWRLRLQHFQDWRAWRGRLERSGGCVHRSWQQQHRQAPGTR